MDIATALALASTTLALLALWTSARRHRAKVADFWVRLDKARDVANEAIGEGEDARKLAGYAVEPLVWALDATEDPRFRYLVTQAVGILQDASLSNDEEMGALVETARLAGAPRRIPTAPMIPPYLARPEDVAARGSQATGGFVERVVGDPPTRTPIDPAAALHAEAQATERALETGDIDTDPRGF